MTLLRKCIRGLIRDKQARVSLVSVMVTDLGFNCEAKSITAAACERSRLLLAITIFQLVVYHMTDIV